MEIKQLAQDFVISHFGVREDFFATAWDVVSANYDRIQSAAFSGSDSSLFDRPLGIAGVEQSEVIKVIIIFVSADKQVGLTSGAQELVAIFQSLCEKFLEQDSNRLTEVILDSVRKSIPESLKNDDDTVRIVPYAMMWINKTKPEGEVIDKQSFAGCEANKAAYKIFIIDRGEFELDAVGEVYLDQQPVFRYPGRKKPSVDGMKDRDAEIGKKHLTPLEYRLLVYILKNAGREDTRFIFDLIRHCWRDAIEADRVYAMIKEDADEAREMTSKHRKKVAELSAFLNARLGIGLQTSGTGKYHLTTYPSFCVLELLKQKL